MSQPDPRPGDEDAFGVLGDPAPVGGRRRRRRSRLPGCLIGLVVLALVGGVLFWGGTKAADWIGGRFGGGDDYAGPGSGSVAIEVRSGDTATAICRAMATADVVASVKACVGAANANPDVTGIQVGTYDLKKQMKASDAIDVLVDPANIVATKVTIPEGLTVKQTLAILSEKTDVSNAALTKALRSSSLGLPSYAKGDAEGYLFPSTYSFAPKTTATQMLRAMVTRWKQAADDVDLEGSASRLGLTPAELMTVASLVEAEGRGDAAAKISRVIYNRLKTTGPPTNGLLQIDATVNYALGRSLVAVPTTKDLQVDSPYNTYRNPGLPPGPIEAPGDAALEAAANPATGPWLFYVTVNLATGETKFTDSYDTFLQYKAELQRYCANESDRC